jgi:hypothetical protein
VRAPPSSREPLPSSVRRTDSGRVGGEQLLLRLRGSARQAARSAPPTAAPSLGRQARFDEVSEGEVHVVAAEHQVIADADARQDRLAVA